MAEEICKIDIARQFSRFPAGRYVADGPFNGEAFRKNFLLPALKSGKKVEISLNDTAGFGSSFLEEAFGGLVRAGWDRERLGSVMTLQCSDQSVLDEIKLYIDNASKTND